MERGWNPWRALRARADIELVWADLPDGTRGAATRQGERVEIILDVALDRRQRRATLAHELVHLERGVMGPVATPATMELEEERVRRETARRLVPLDRLARCPMVRSGEGVTAGQVAECWDVPEEVATCALRLLSDAGVE